MRLSALALSLALAAGSAAAADRPAAMPSRDAEVRYKVEDGTPSAFDTVAWLAAEGRIRAEGGAPPGRVAHLIDTRSGEVTAVMDAARTYQELGPMAAVMLGSLLPIAEGNAVRAEGTDKVAGLECTVWRIDPGKGATDEAVKRLCMTRDGVPLRLVEGEGEDAETLYVATHVDDGPQDPRRFRRPEGYAPLK